MHESKLRRVEHEARRVHHRAAVAADVDALADHRVSGLGEVDSDLVRPARLELTREERTVSVRLAVQALDDLDVRDGDLRTLATDRLLATSSVLDRSAEAVAAIRTRQNTDAFVAIRLNVSFPAGSSSLQATFCHGLASAAVDQMVNREGSSSAMLRS